MRISTPKSPRSARERRRVEMRLRDAAIAISAVAAAVVLAGCTDDTHGDQQTLEVTELATGGQFHPVGDPWPEANKPGGGFTFAGPLSSSSGEGELNGVCIFFTEDKGGKGGKAECTGTFDLPDGQLVVVGGRPGGHPRSGAIVGGTGEYAGASGTYESVKQEAGGAVDTFNITLP
jgi:hypothetical protein